MRGNDSPAWEASTAQRSCLGTTEAGKNAGQRDRCVQGREDAGPHSHSGLAFCACAHTSRGSLSTRPRSLRGWEQHNGRRSAPAQAAEDTAQVLCAHGHRMAAATQHHVTPSQQAHLAILKPL